MELTIKQIKEKIDFCKAMINIETDKKRKEFISYFKIDTNNIGINAWSNDEIDKILNRAIRELTIELCILEKVKKVVQEAMFQSPTTALSMSTTVFNQIVRDQILNEITGDKENKLFNTKE